VKCLIQREDQRFVRLSQLMLTPLGGCAAFCRSPLREGMRGLALLLCVIQIMLLAQTPERSGHWREFTQPRLGFPGFLL